MWPTVLLECRHGIANQDFAAIFLQATRAIFSYGFLVENPFSYVAHKALRSAVNGVDYGKPLPDKLADYLPGAEVTPYFRQLNQFDEKLAHLIDQMFAFNDVGDSGENHVSADVEHLDLLNSRSPLFFNAEQFDQVRQRVDDRIEKVVARAPEWEFWQRWYLACREGRQLDVGLQEMVLQIPDDFWEAGPKAVAEKIAEIETRLELEARIGKLEKASLVAPNRHGIGGNHPPESFDADAVRKEITIIWAGIDGLKAEVESAEPDKKIIERIIATLSSSLRVLLAFCGRMVEHATKVAITVAVSAGVARVVDPELLDAVINAAKNWLATL